ncbi:ATP-binding protein [Thiotrichales bacterium HSG1]|nr:ATP-binding protein [Thiotrichales bacterium HSG1]
MIQTFGEFIEIQPQQGEYLTIGFSPSNRSLKDKWENNGLSADFIAEYFKVFFIGNLYSNNQHKEEIIISNIKDTVKYISNELLENAMKFQNDSLHFTAKVGLSLYEDKLAFCVTNCIDEQQVELFQDFIKKLLGSDPQELYFKTMRNNALTSDNNRSGLGLLSMICDYSVKLGWKFETIQAPLTTVVTTVVLLEICEFRKWK